MGAATGAKGSVTVIRALSPDEKARPLAGYQRFELGKLDDRMNGQGPAGLWGKVAERLPGQLRSKGIPDRASGKTAVINGTLLHYEGSGAMGLALGPTEFAVARVELADKASGKVLGVANCVGRTNERVNMGLDKKAEGLAKAIAEWIDQNYPTEGRTNE